MLKILKEKEMILRILDRLNVDGNPIDVTVDILDKEDVPIPYGINRTVNPPDRATWTGKQVSLAQVEKAWDNFNLDLYMAVCRFKLDKD